MHTDLECFRATVERRRPEKVLGYADFTPDLKRRMIEHCGTEDLAGHYGMMRRAHIGLAPPPEREPIDYGRYYRDIDLPAGARIDAAGVAHVPGSMYHFESMISPLRNAASLAEIEAYPMEDLSTWSEAHMAAAVASAHADGAVAVAWIGHMYETAWQIRGYEPFLMDMVERPAWAECLLERLAAANLRKATAAARAGVDVLQCGDDVANQNALMFAPAMWRRFMRPRWQRVWEQARAIDPEVCVWYHSDGNIAAIVGELIDAGVTILNPVQPECLDTDALHARYGDRLCFDGCIGTQSTMPWGSSDDVRARVKEVITKYGREGGLIVSPTHILEPEVPPANVDALFDALRQYGRLG